MKAVVSLALAGALLTGCTTARPVAPTAVAAPASPAKPYQWLHGSAEAAILSRQAYAAMTRYVETALDRRARGLAVQSAVLADGAKPATPVWAPCDRKPPAIVLDIDETVLLNTGANYDAAVRGDPPFDPARWARYEATGGATVEPVPGAPEALAVLRQRGVAIVFNSNRENTHVAGTRAALATAGVGDAIPGETLFLRGDVASGSGKDPRRAAIAARYCVLAMGGDQLGDFADAFNDRTLSVQARRTLGQAPAIRDKWGAGWFLLPNPLYGPGVAGGFDDLFPADKRWAPEEK